MPDLSLLKAELAVYGIRVDDSGRCEVMRGADRLVSTLQHETAQLQQAVKANKNFLRELWRELAELLASAPISIAPGNDVTQRLFASALVQLHTIAGQFDQLVRERTILNTLLKQDVYRFSEAFMSKVVQYRLVIDWIDQLIRIDLYKARLMKMLERAPVTAQSGPWTGGIWLNDEERVIDGTDDYEEDRIHDGRKVMAPYDKENMLPETYNDPYKFEAGFYYRDRNQEPYAFDDEEENPYPHRNLLWQ